ncbi:MAG: hypothetical protein JXB26_05265 [Candidatus Aminicenantes bacterium]|nr:hypothetical protein [Candidatus Aminicenantes bacterium]
MKNLRLRFLFIIMAVFLSGCISFRIAPPDWPDKNVDAFLFCRDVKEIESLLEPVGTDDVFSTEETFVLAFVRLKDVSEKLSLRWKWYGPQGNEIRDTGEVPVSDGTRYLEAVTAYDRIGVSLEKTPPGEYITVLFINGTLSSKITFNLR